MCSAKPGPIRTLTDKPFVHKCSYTDRYAQWTDCLGVLPLRTMALEYSPLFDPSIWVEINNSDPYSGWEGQKDLLIISGTIL